MPEVSLVAILDADKEGFLRSTRSLIQTIGRAARNLNGRAILYADKITRSMKIAMDETDRRRAKQEQYNTDKGIVPQSVRKAVRDIIDGATSEATQLVGKSKARGSGKPLPDDPKQLAKMMSELEKETVSYTHLTLPTKA